MIEFLVIVKDPAYTEDVHIIEAEDLETVENWLYDKKEIPEDVCEVIPIENIHTISI
jgi:hypothetical protein